MHTVHPVGAKGQDVHERPRQGQGTAVAILFKVKFNVAFYFRWFKGSKGLQHSGLVCGKDGGKRGSGKEWEARWMLHHITPPWGLGAVGRIGKVRWCLVLCQQ